MSNDSYERPRSWSDNDHPMDATAADIELLPLYSKLQGHPEIEIIKHYAHDNVAHHTEKLHAKIEALRAEVDESDAVLRVWRRRTAEAEARADKLAEALRELKDLMLRQVKWEPCDCGCPQQRTPAGPHSVTWLRAAQQVEIAINKAEGKE